MTIDDKVDSILCLMPEKKNSSLLLKKTSKSMSKLICSHHTILAKDY